MRYIVDSDKYVKEVSFGADITCGYETCTEYTGTVPTGYVSLEDWYLAEAEKLYRWRIVAGNLTLDSSAVPPVEGCLPSFLKIRKSGDTTDYSTIFNYFDPLRSITDSYGVGNFYSGTYEFETTYGDRDVYTVSGIYVGPGIRGVRVGASVRYLNNSSTGCVLSTFLIRARENSFTYIGQQSDTAAASSRVSHSLSTITSVEEGDFLCLMSYRSNTAIDIDVIGDYLATQLYAEAIM